MYGCNECQFNMGGICGYSSDFEGQCVEDKVIYCEDFMMSFEKFVELGQSGVPLYAINKYSQKKQY